jgi:serine/threonine protein phosphatase 1
MNLQRFAHFESNRHGRDFVVGDIQGYFRKMESELKRLQFNPEVDRLFATGDLVNRGPESQACLEWLDKPWFFSVMGNHESLVYHYGAGLWDDTEDLRSCGGQWFLDLSESNRKVYSERLGRLPYALEVEQLGKLAGVIHSEVWSGDWAKMRAELESAKHDKEIRSVWQTAIWKRGKLEAENQDHVKNIDMLFVGHTTVLRPKTLGNVMYIDCAGWTDNGYFAIVDMRTHHSQPPITPSTHWVNKDA